MAAVLPGLRTMIRLFFSDQVNRQRNDDHHARFKYYYQNPATSVTHAYLLLGRRFGKSSVFLQWDLSGQVRTLHL